MKKRSFFPVFYLVIVTLFTFVPIVVTIVYSLPAALRGHGHFPRPEKQPHPRRAVLPGIGGDRNARRDRHEKDGV